MSIGYVKQIKDGQRERDKQTDSQTISTSDNSEKQINIQEDRQEKISNMNDR